MGNHNHRNKFQTSRAASPESFVLLLYSCRLLPGLPAKRHFPPIQTMHKVHLYLVILLEDCNRQDISALGQAYMYQTFPFLLTQHNDALNRVSFQRLVILFTTRMYYFVNTSLLIASLSSTISESDE